MLTRRIFLSAAGAAIALPVGSLRAETQAPSLRFKDASSLQAPSGKPGGAVGVDGLTSDGALRLTSGQPAACHVANDLRESLVPSWRDLRGVGDLDHPIPAIAPGTEADLPVPASRPGTVLLRAAPSPDRLSQRGAQAVMVISGQNDPPVDHDLVLHLNDWLIAADGTAVFGSVPPTNARSGLVTVNGSAAPRIIALAPRGRVRLRIVNGSGQRPMLVTCTGGHPKVAAIDGQPSELFAPVRDTVPIGPGARYDLLFDMPETDGAEIRFLLKPTLTIAGALEAARDLMILQSRGTAVTARPAIAALPVNPDLPPAIPLENARRVELTIGGRPGTADSAPTGWHFSTPKGSGPGEPIMTVRRGDTVTLGFTNATSALVPLRIAGHPFRLLHAKDDGWEPYWRDTLMVPPQGRAHVAFIADRPGRWPIDSGFDDLTLAGLSCFFTVGPR